MGRLVRSTNETNSDVKADKGKLNTPIPIKEETTEKAKVEETTLPQRVNVGNENTQTTFEEDVQNDVDRGSKLFNSTASNPILNSYRKRSYDFGKNEAEGNLGSSSISTGISGNGGTQGININATDTSKMDSTAKNTILAYNQKLNLAPDLNSEIAQPKEQVTNLAPDLNSEIAQGTPTIQDRVKQLGEKQTWTQAEKEEAKNILFNMGDYGESVPTNILENQDNLKLWQKYHSGGSSAVAGFMQGSGIKPLAEAIGTLGESIANTTTDESGELLIPGDSPKTKQYFNELNNYVNEIKNTDTKGNIGYTAGNILGNVALMSAVGKVSTPIAANSTQGALKFLKPLTQSAAGQTLTKNIARTVGSVVNNAMTFSISSAIHNIGNLATNDAYNIQDYGKDVLGSGLVGGISSGLIRGLTNIGFEKVLVNKGTQTLFNNFLKNSVASALYSTSNAGIDYAFHYEPSKAYIESAKKQNPNLTDDAIKQMYQEQLNNKFATQLLTTFVYSLAFNFLSGVSESKQAEKSLKELYDKYVYDVAKETQSFDKSVDDMSEYFGRMMRATEDAKQVLNSTYFAGQQKGVDELNQIFDNYLNELYKIKYQLDFGDVEGWANQSTTDNSLLQLISSSIADGFSAKEMVDSVVPFTNDGIKTNVDAVKVTPTTSISITKLDSHVTSADTTAQNVIDGNGTKEDMLRLTMYKSEINNAINSGSLDASKVEQYKSVVNKVDTALGNQPTYEVEQPKQEVAEEEPTGTTKKATPYSKKIGNLRIFHKSQIDSNIDAVKNAPTDSYDLIEANTDNGDLLYVSAPGFDTETEPVINKVIAVHSDGSVEDVTPSTPTIITNKGELVPKDYQGFDVQKALDRQSLWQSAAKIDRTLSYNPQTINQLQNFNTLMSKINAKNRTVEPILTQQLDPIEAVQPTVYNIQEEGITNGTGERNEVLNSNGERIGTLVNRIPDQGNAEREIPRGDARDSQLQQPESTRNTTEIGKESFKEVDSSEIVTSGNKGTKVKVLTPEYIASNNELQRIVDMAKEDGVTPILFLGNVKVDGVDANGFQEGETIGIRVDNPYVSPEGYYWHESRVHSYASKYPGFIEKVVDSFNDDQYQKFSFFVMEYAKAYNDKNIKLPDSIEEEVLARIAAADNTIRKLFEEKGREYPESIGNESDLTSTVREAISLAKETLKDVPDEEKDAFSKFTLELVSKEVIKNEIVTKTAHDINKMVVTYQISNNLGTVSDIPDFKTTVNITDFDIAEKVHTNLERIADWMNIYKFSPKITSFKSAVWELATAGKLKSVPQVGLNQGCGRIRTVLEYIKNKILPRQTRTESCFGGTCWANFLNYMKNGKFTNMDARDMKIANPDSIKNWFDDEKSAKSYVNPNKLLTHDEKVAYLNSYDFTRHGSKGDDSHAIANGSVLEWLKACKENGIVAKQIFISASYAPVTKEQYKELLPYKDMFYIHFSNSGWFHKNEIMIRLNEFKKARDAGLNVAIRLVTNKDKVDGMRFPNESFLEQKIEELGIISLEDRAKYVLQTPYHNDGTHIHSKPLEKYPTVCCGTGYCNTCSVRCMIATDPNYNTWATTEFADAKQSSDEWYEKNSNVKLSANLLDEIQEQSEINRSMSMKQADHMLESVWNLYGKGTENPNFNKWLQETDNDTIELLVESNYNLYKKYVLNNPLLKERENPLVSVMESYRNGTLVGNTNPFISKIDVSRDRRITEDTIYAPKNTEKFLMDKVSPKTWEVATQRVTKSNKADVTEARKDILFASHYATNDSLFGTMTIEDYLGVTPQAINQKLSSWSNYPAYARSLSRRINEGVGDSNKWTGLENSSALNTANITDDDIKSLVKEVKGASSGEAAYYIGKSMMALDTHINWTGLTFDFVKGLADPKRSNTLGTYTKATETITVGGNKAGDTVAHEMGHALGHIWGRELIGQDTDISTAELRDKYYCKTKESQSFFDHFMRFMDDITYSNDVGSEYKQSPDETFARFVAKFIDWTQGTAGARQFGENRWYRDKFTTNQYIEFAKILQEKAALDTSYQVASHTNPDLLPLYDINEITPRNIITKNSKAPIPDDIKFSLDLESVGRTEILDSTYKGDIKTTGVSFREELIYKGNTNLVGKTISNAEDLATAAQVLRDPRFETSRIFFLDADNKVIAHTGLSSRVPDFTGIIPDDYKTVEDYLDSVVAKANNLGATSVYTMHNHPNSRPIPSTTDLKIVRGIAELYSARGLTYNGEIILNSNEYAFIPPRGRFSVNKINENTVDELLEPGIDNELLGKTIKDVMYFASLAKGMQLSNGYGVATYINSDLKIVATQEISTSLLKNKKEASAMLLDQMKRFGSDGVLIATSDRDAYDGAVALMQGKGVMDAVLVSPDSLRYGVIDSKRGSWVGRRGTSFYGSKPICESYWSDKNYNSDVKSILTDESKTTKQKISELKQREITKPLYGKKISSGVMLAGGGLKDYAVKEIEDIVFAVEYKPQIAMTFGKNFDVKDLYAGETEGNVINVDYSKYNKSVDYVHASPNCENFSAVNTKPGEVKNDIDIAKSIVRAIQEVYPKIFTLEQVPRYLNSISWNIIKRELEKNYNYTADVYNSADYGASVNRNRLFVRAMRKDLGIELPKMPERIPAQSWYDVTNDLIPQLEERKLSPWMEERYDESKYDKSRFPILILGGKQNGGLMTAYADEPSPSLTTKFDQAVVIMPDGKTLSVTPRFEARIMGLGDDYILPTKNTKKGEQLSKTRAFEVIGNGIPVQLTRAALIPLFDALYPEDSVEVKLSASLFDDEYKKAFEQDDKNTQYRIINGLANANGYIESVWHGTNKEFRAFDLGKSPEGFHTGTYEQALDRAALKAGVPKSELRIDEDAYVMPLYINPGSPLIIPFDIDNWAPYHVAELLYQKAMTRNATISKSKSMVGLHSISLKMWDEANNPKEFKAYTLKFNDYAKTNGIDMNISYGKDGYTISNNGKDILTTKNLQIALTKLMDITGESTKEDWETWQLGEIKLSPKQERDLKANIDDLIDIQQTYNSKEGNIKLAQFINNVLGYQSIKYFNHAEGDKNSFSFLVYDPTRIKSSALATFDIDGNLILPSQRFNPDEEDVNLSVDLLSENNRLKQENNQLKNDRSYYIRVNQQLTKDLAKAQHEMTITKKPYYTLESATGLAKSIIDTYQSRLDPNRINQKMLDLANMILYPKKTGLKQDDWYLIQDKAYDIANDVVNNSSAIFSGDVDLYRNMYYGIKQMKFLISDATKNELNAQSKNGYDFWKRSNQGYITFSNSGETINDIYQGLNEQYGEDLFPDDPEATEVDKVERITSILRQIRPIMANPYSLNMAEARDAVATDILASVIYGDGFEFQAPTKADTLVQKGNEKVAEVRAKAQGKLAEVREDRDAKLKALQDKKNEQIAKLRKEKNDKYNEMVKASRERYNTKVKQMRQEKYDAIKELKNHYKDMALRKREKKLERLSQERLINLVRKVKKLKTTEAWKNQINNIIFDIDDVGVKMLDKTKWKLEDLRNEYMARWKADPTGFIQIPGVEEKFARLEKRQIADMSQEEIEMLTEILSNLYANIMNEKKLMNSQAIADRYEAMRYVINDVRNAYVPKGLKFNNFLAEEMYNPVRFIHRIVGYNNDDPLYILFKEAFEKGSIDESSFKRMADDQFFTKFTNNKELMESTRGKKAEVITDIIAHRPDLRVAESKDGQITVNDFQSSSEYTFMDFEEMMGELSKIYTGQASINDIKQELDEWYATSNGTPYEKKMDVPVTMTRGTMILLRALAEDNDAARHIEGGGVSLPGFDYIKKGDFVNAVKQPSMNVTFTRKELRDLDGRLTEDEKALIKAMFDYGYYFAKPRINEVSEQMVGYPIANQPYGYVSIHTDPTYFTGDLEQGQQARGQKNITYGWLNERVESTKPIKITDIWDQINRTERENARYVGMAIPLHNLNKLIGSAETDYNNNIMRTIITKWKDDGAASYIFKSINDLIGTKGSYDKAIQIYKQLISNYSQAVLSFNAGVALTQTASYYMALPIVGYKALAKAVVDPKPVDKFIVDKYSPLQHERRMGFSSVEMGDLTLRNDGKKPNPLMNWNQFMDILTTDALWKACEYKVQEDNKDLTPGTDAYYKKVGELHSQVLIQTQPMFDNAFRGGILRVGDSGMKTLFGMFKTELFQQYGLIGDALGEAKAAAYYAKNADSEAERLKYTSQARTAAKKASASITGAILSALTIAAIRLGRDIARGKLKGKDDDKKEKYIVDSILKNMISSTLGMVMGGDVIDSFVNKFVFDDTFYGPSNPVGDLLEDLSYLMTNLEKAIDKGLDLSTEKGMDKLFDIIGDAISLIGSTTGIPASNLIKIFNVLKNIATGYK